VNYIIADLKCLRKQQRRTSLRVDKLVAVTSDYSIWFGSVIRLDALVLLAGKQTQKTSLKITW